VVDEEYLYRPVLFEALPLEGREKVNQSLYGSVTCSTILMISEHRKLNNNMLIIHYRIDIQVYFVFETISFCQKEPKILNLCHQ